jgi:hypothetical protein
MANDADRTDRRRRRGDSLKGTWSWSVSDLGRLASQLQWPVDRPAANGVAFLGTGYHPMNSFAMVTCRDDVAISIVVPMTDRINSWFPDRVGAFAQTVAAATSVLGPSKP